MSNVRKYQVELLDVFKNAVNTYGIDTETNIPDFILAEHLLGELKNLVDTANAIDKWVNGANEELEDLSEPNEDMDGDARTALASAGFGTDEDYGGTDDRF